MNASDNLSSQLPLTEVTYFILLSLSSGAKHGYAIMKEVDQVSQGRVKLSTGTLYSALKRQLEEGWIQRVAEPAGDGDQGNSRRRKSYVLSQLGRQILQAEVLRLRGLLSVAEARTAGIS